MFSVVSVGHSVFLFLCGGGGVGGSPCDYCIPVLNLFTCGPHIYWQASGWLSTGRHSYFYRPQRSCGQGNIFIGVCQEFCQRGGVCLTWRGQTPPGSATPPGQTPPSQTPPGSDPPGPDIPGTRYTPLGLSTPPGLSTPLGLSTTPRTKYSPRTKYTPRSRLRHTVNERPVRILLECILVKFVLAQLFMKSCAHVVERTWNNMP